MPQPLPPPGTFRLHPFARPPLRAGGYLLTGDVTGLPGPVEQLPVTLEVVAPRFALPPDQILGTFPPAGARGAFSSRLPQVVLRRRTLPWERSPEAAPDETPLPWLALVLIAEGEGELVSDEPVEQCVTAGVSLGADRDVPKGSYLAVPQRVVDRVFPTRDDLPLLAHVREVDLRDTELAMGDDDGWMAAVLCNRLPQPDTRYLACLINLEGQWDELPTIPDDELLLHYDPRISVVDLRALAGAQYGAAAAADTSVMGLPGSGAAAATAADTGPVIRSARGPAVPAGSGWAVATPAVQAAAPAAARGKLALADGFSFPAVLAGERTLRFPVLAYWSFQCEERGDFQYLAEHVVSRLLGHVAADPSQPETPDGDPPAAGGADPPGAAPEPGAGRPLPLVAETGHVALATVTRAGDPAEAWYRGPLSPTPVERATARPDGDPRPPLAHHADQLRRVTPDGREDLGYAAAFEIGRLLALSQPGVAGALARWRQEAFGAARAAGLGQDAAAELPDDVRSLLGRPDPLGADSAERLVPGGAGRRAARALLQLLGSDPSVLGPSRPLVDPAAEQPLDALLDGGRDQAVVAGLGLAAVLDGVDGKDAGALAERLAVSPPQVAGERDPVAEAAVLRGAVERAAARLAAGALDHSGLGEGPKP